MPSAAMAADDVFADDRADRRTTVTPSREAAATGSFELKIKPVPVNVENFTKQDGPPIAKLRHEASELMPRVRLCNWLGTWCDLVSGKHSEAIRTFQELRIDAQLSRKRIVDAHEFW
jgi:hypothetical protein